MEIIIFITVCFLLYKAVDTSNRKKYLRSEHVHQDRNKIEVFNKKLSSLLMMENYYITIDDTSFHEEYSSLFHKLKKHKILDKIEFYTNFFEAYEQFQQTIKQKNEQFIQSELIAHKNLFDNIDGKALDIQQRRAVIVDNINNLVLAGAGSGKTLTIAAKTKYLVETKNIKPEDILLISFTKKSSEEMAKRISEKLNVDIQVKTFHKLGLDLIVQKYNKRPEIQSNLGNVIDEYFSNTVYKNNKYLYMIIEFFSYYLQIPKEIGDFESLDSYHEYQMSLDYETLMSKASLAGYIDKNKTDMRNDKVTFKKERVRSFEELIIANFLFLNGVKYEYERVYPYESPDKTKKRYCPDFYLSDYDIYIEHFGINEEGLCPQYSQVESEKYQQDMKWKRTFHKEHNTTLIETYSYMNSKGQLIDKLDHLLKSHGVMYKPVDRKQVFESVFNDKENRYLNDFKKLISTFVHLFKSSGYNSQDFKVIDKLADHEEKDFLKIRSKLFFRIVRPIHEHYQNHLTKNGFIDFNDMINIATYIVSTNEVPLSYKYIIIDEYQDISQSRYKLIKAIKDKTKAKLLCVGDDWQSIYRFAGSDISLFSDFESYYGPYELNKIEKTYRNSQELIDIAGKFVMQNKMQLRKSLKSDKNRNNPIDIIGHSGNKIKALEYTLQKIVAEFGMKTDILLIGRNNFDVNFLSNSENFQIKMEEKGMMIAYLKYPTLKISFMSAHRSKGIEATNVIVVNGENDKLGFPNKTSDDPVLSYVLTKLDPFEYAEERRLFYVALTRTKNKTYILSTNMNESVFVKELMRKQQIRMNKTNLENTSHERLNCPKCLVGILTERRAANSKKLFVGCSNYPNCDYTVPSTSILTENKKCSCGGYLIKRKGQYGEFFGCSNYPVCTHRLKA
ncbi:MAG: UvrD-helicase domain-containing protein [Clostridiales bacterium]|nr:UvrD-helicase domain-containing protein [Clostridiales bacterium]